MPRFFDPASLPPNASLGRLVPHCPACMVALPPPHHFCARCGMPVSFYATSAPLEQVWAFGYMVNRLLSDRPTTFTLLGTWLLATPIILALAPAAVGFALVPPALTSIELVGGIPWLLIAGLHLLLTLRVTVAYCRSRRQHMAGRAT